MCGGADCKRFPDIEVHASYPFLSEEHKRQPQDPPAPRPKGKRRPAEDRARRLEEDR